jgi:hypothetical protein
MLQMIFQNQDLMDEYRNYYENDYSIYQSYHPPAPAQSQSQSQSQSQTQKNNHYSVHVESINDEDWGFYVEFDPPTPPRHVFPKKNNTLYSNPNLNLAIKTPTSPIPPPSSYYNYNDQTQQKNVNYLPQIEEEDNAPQDQFVLDMDLPHDHSNSNRNSNNNNQTYKDYNEKISQKIFSGLTICALTTASIYFYNKIRSS